MSAPITRHQRELCNLAVVIAQQQESIDGLQRYLKRLHDAKEELVRRAESLTEERETLLAENGQLRANIDRVSKHEADTINAMSAAWQRVEGELKGELDGLESLIHRLCDERVMARLDYGTLDKMTKLYQAQSLEFCRNYEREETRADKLQSEVESAKIGTKLAREYSSHLIGKNRELRAENKRLHEATEDDLRTITSLRAEVKRLKSRKLKGSR